MEKYEGLKYYLENVDASIPENIKNDLLKMMEELKAIKDSAKKKRVVNTSGVVQVDAETGKEIARFKTKAEANLKIGKKEKATGIGDAVAGRSKTHFAYGYKWYHADEWDAMNK